MTPAHEYDDDPEIEEIAPYVLADLERKEFFKNLEDEIFPTKSADHQKCDGSYSVTKRLLTEAGYDEDDQSDIVLVMHSRGGFCDCEIILNAAPSSPTREAYWKARASNVKVE